MTCSKRSVAVDSVAAVVPDKDKNSKGETFSNDNINYTDCVIKMNVQSFVVVLGGG